MHASPNYGGGAICVEVYQTSSAMWDRLCVSLHVYMYGVVMPISSSGVIGRCRQVCCRCRSFIVAVVVGSLMHIALWLRRIAPARFLVQLRGTMGKRARATAAAGDYDSQHDDPTENGQHRLLAVRIPRSNIGEIELKTLKSIAEHLAENPGNILNLWGALSSGGEITLANPKQKKHAPEQLYWDRSYAYWKSVPKYWLCASRLLRSPA